MKGREWGKLMKAMEKILPDQWTEETFDQIQLELVRHIELENRLEQENIHLVAGVDLAYWESAGTTHAVCCICVVDVRTHAVLEVQSLRDEIKVPYIPGYLSFRELPLIMDTFKQLEHDPDIVMFDGNGFLHPRNMGIATHASFYMNKPTIGVAKSYLKIGDTDYVMPADKAGAYTDIVVDGRVYGRTLRTHQNVKPVFVSCGNWIDLDTATGMVLGLVNKESRLPIPVRLADLETKKCRAAVMRESEAAE